MYVCRTCINLNLATCCPYANHSLNLITCYQNCKWIVMCHLYLVRNWSPTGLRQSHWWDFYAKNPKPSLSSSVTALIRKKDDKYAPKKVMWDVEDLAKSSVIARFHNLQIWSKSSSFFVFFIFMIRVYNFCKNRSTTET